MSSKPSLLFRTDRAHQGDAGVLHRAFHAVPSPSWSRPRPSVRDAINDLESRHQERLRIAGPGRADRSPCSRADWADPLIERRLVAAFAHHKAATTLQWARVRPPLNCPPSVVISCGTRRRSQPPTEQTCAAAPREDHERSMSHTPARPNRHGERALAAMPSRHAVAVRGRCATRFRLLHHGRTCEALSSTQHSAHQSDWRCAPHQRLRWERERAELRP